MNGTKNWIIVGMILFGMFTWWLWKVFTVSSVDVAKDAVVEPAQTVVEENLKPANEEDQGWLEWAASYLPSFGSDEEPKKDDETPGEIIQRQLDPLK